MISAAVMPRRSGVPSSVSVAVIMGLTHEAGIEREVLLIDYVASFRFR
jgi:hypothetical protein